MDRGNFESLLFIFLLLFIFFYLKKRYAISAVILALAISTKLYPAILLVLFIPERKYREIALSLFTTVVITFMSLLFFKGGFLPNLSFLLEGANFGSNSLFAQFTSITSNTVQRGVTLLTLIKIFYFETGILPGFIKNHFLMIYMIVASMIGLFVLLYVIFLEKEMWKKVALLIFSMLLLPPISADYKLLYVFIPLFIFLNNKNSSRVDLLYLVLFGLMLIPKDYIFFTAVISDARGSPHDISISVVINIFILIGMSVVIMVTGARNWFSNLHKPAHSVIITSPRNL